MSQFFPLPFSPVCPQSSHAVEHRLSFALESSMLQLRDCPKIGIACTEGKSKFQEREIVFNLCEEAKIISKGVKFRATSFYIIVI